MQEQGDDTKRDKSKASAEEMVAKLHEESSNSAEMDVEITDSTTKTADAKANTESAQIDEKAESTETADGEKPKVANQRTFNIDDLRKRTTAILNREDADKKVVEERMTRLKSTQIANGTYLFKLGMENQFKSYINQYTTNIIALNKPQRNEERDKKRHLSHKFSLTAASEFKWMGGIGGNKSSMVNTIRQTILQLEQSLQAPFMHLNWHLIRKPWLNAVGACQLPKDFAKTLIVLQACIKPVVFANVWHDQLGHIKLFRITAGEREERKKIEKREKKEREEEEERNRMIITGYVKYTMSFKHQLWKQKGEEYRIHGRWGWLWLSSTRIHKIVNSNELGLAAGPQKIMIQVEDNGNFKNVVIEPKMHQFLVQNVNKTGHLDIKEKQEDGSGDYARPQDYSKLFYFVCYYLP